MIPPITGYSKIDLDRALRIAQRRWEIVEEATRERLPHAIKSLFESWKIEHGQKLPSGGMLGAIFNPELAVSEKDRIEHVNSHEAWECLPFWVSHNPIDLIIHIWASDYCKSFRNEMPIKSYKMLIDSLAWLVTQHHETKNPNWHIAMIKASLRLADEEAEAVKRKYLEDYPHIVRSKRANHNIIMENNRDLERIKIIKSEIHNAATGYMERNIDKSKIVSLIHKHYSQKTENKKTNEIRTMSKRQIRRYLEDHPSGLFKPQKRKTKNKK
jgi:hypothetical protein